MHKSLAPRKQVLQQWTSDSVTKEKDWSKQTEMNQITATGKACVPTYKIYKKEEFGKMLLQDNRDKMETNQRTAVIVEFSKLLFCFCGFTDTGRPLKITNHAQIKTEQKQMQEKKRCTQRYHRMISINSLHKTLD